MKTNVIFDVNAYRNLTLKCPIGEIEQKLREIRSAEAEKGISVHLSIIVLTELLNHLSKDERDEKERDACLNGIIASILHSRNQIGNNNEFKFRPSLNNIVLHDIFGIIDEKEKNYNESVLSVCNDITNGILNGKTIEQLQNDNSIDNAIKKNLKNSVENRKNEYQVFTNIIKGFNHDVNLERSEIGNQKTYKLLTKGPGKEKKFATIMAKAYLHGTVHFFKQHNLTVSESKIQLFLNIYKSAIKNMQDFFIKFNAGTNLSDHNRAIWNTINDTHLLMNCHLKDERVILVTCDKKMKFDDSENLQKMQLNDYLRFLDIRHPF